MFPGRQFLAFILLSLVAPATAALSAAEVNDFSRPQLLERFDQNQDGSFDLSERHTISRAFGGIEVPALPVPPYRYTDWQVSADLEGALFESDNGSTDNPVSDSGARLGRVLFYDRQLSANNTTACASCHFQRHGFSDPARFSRGYLGGRTGRNAMGLINMRFTNVRGGQPGFFWDERAATLEDQVLMPIQDKVEMGMELEALEEKLAGVPYYPPLFQSAFGDRQVTSTRIARAVAQFMRAMISFESRFDRAARTAGGDYSAEFAEFSPVENHGKDLFINGVGGVAEIGCAHCHVPPTFAMPMAFNNGLDRSYTDAGLGALDIPSNDPFTPTNDGKFKAPSLRNVAVTAPYMHDGRFQTLREVVEHYSQGVHPHKNLGLAFTTDDAAGKSGFQFTDEQITALVAFLETLTDEVFLSDPRFSDPFLRLEPLSRD